MNNSSAEILSSLGVHMSHPTSGFIKWLDESQLSWLTGAGCLEMFPHAHTEFKVSERVWAYLWTENHIKANAVGYGFRYMGIGSLAGGQWIAVDTQLQERPMIGSVGLSSLLKAEKSNSTLVEGDFDAFDLSLGEWLDLIRENPLRRDIPN